MIERSRFTLNRIAAPAPGLEEFFRMFNLAAVRDRLLDELEELLDPAAALKASVAYLTE